MAERVVPDEMSRFILGMMLGEQAKYFDVRATEVDGTLSSEICAAPFGREILEEYGHDPTDSAVLALLADQFMEVVEQGIHNYESPRELNVAATVEGWVEHVAITLLNDNRLGDASPPKTWPSLERGLTR